MFLQCLSWGYGFFAYSWKLPSYSGAFLLTLDNFSSFAYSWRFFACSGKVRQIRGSRDCKQRSLTVSKKAPTVSQKNFPLKVSLLKTLFLSSFSECSLSCRRTTIRWHHMESKTSSAKARPEEVTCARDGGRDDPTKGRDGACFRKRPDLRVVFPLRGSRTPPGADIPNAFSGSVFPFLGKESRKGGF